MDKLPITKEGSERLISELEKLKTVDRPAVVQAIAEARAHGDLKENAEYHAAREQQGFLEGRISHIEAALANSQIIDVATLPQTGKVMFGTTVTVYYLDDESEHTYTIVGDIESDINENKISISSPVAQALIGKEVGDEVEITLPAGVRELEIINLRY
jgi:transcription elongation factor GreA